jgi:hypothetical protein
VKRYSLRLKETLKQGSSPLSEPFTGVNRLAAAAQNFDTHTDAFVADGNGMVFCSGQL